MVRFLVCFCCVSFFVQDRAQAREVNSIEDEIRIKGYPEYLQLKNQLEKERLSDVSLLEKERQEREKEQKKALEEYRVEKSRQQASLDEIGPEYREYVESRLAEREELKRLQKEYVEQRDRKRREFQSVVTLTEEEELGIKENPVRVDWRKRNLLGKLSMGSGMSGSPTRPSDFASPSFPAAPPPPLTDYFGPNNPPPPRPPEPGFFDESIPPPPPMFDDEPPF